MRTGSLSNRATATPPEGLTYRPAFIGEDEERSIVEEVERQMIERALRVHHFNISLAAGELGLSRGALYRRMEKYGL